MAQQINGKDVKDKIRKYLEEKGPSLPIPIAKHISMNTLFASAFLSEMSSEGTIKISNMKVGGSPLYYTQSKVDMLENFTKFLGEKQQEAQSMLKQQSILQDETLHPAIRVALRSLKDFAIPFKKDSKVFWRYFMVSEDKVREMLNEKLEEPEQKKQEPERKETEIKKPEEAKPEKIKEDRGNIAILENLNKEIEEKKKELEKINQQLSEIVKQRKKGKQPSLHQVIKKPAKKKQKRTDEKFLNEVKKILSQKDIEILRLEGFSSKEVTAKVKLNDQEHLLVAYNKKKISDSEIIKAYKKASALNLPYYIISKGEASKKTIEALEAFKKLSAIDKIEVSEDINEQKTLEQ